MKCSVEITLYPIREDYVTPIDAFIRNLRAEVDGSDAAVEVNAMSTQVFGNYEAVMGAVTRAMQPTLAELPGAFVMKVLGIDAREPH